MKTNRLEAIVEYWRLVDRGATARGRIKRYRQDPQELAHAKRTRALLAGKAGALRARLYPLPVIQGGARRAGAGERAA